MKLTKHSQATGKTLTWEILRLGRTVTTRWQLPSGVYKTNTATLPTDAAATTYYLKKVASKKRGGYKEGQEQKQGQKQEQKKKVHEPLAPMLANKFFKLSKKAQDSLFPCYWQIKYNGVRGVWSAKDQTLWSRTGHKKELLPELLEDLSRFPYPLDGELWIPGYKLQDINSIASRTVERHPDSDKLRYVVYDLPIAGPTFDQRISMLMNIRHLFNERILIAPTRPCSSYEECMTLFEQHKAQGHEGLILRSSKGVYRFGARSGDLLKVKTEDDEDFEITGIKAAVDGCALLVLQTSDGKSFTAVVEASKEFQRSLLNKANTRSSLIGRTAKVAFAEWTAEGIPSHGRVTLIEGYETHE